jgi:hypothetical protein
MVCIVEFGFKEAESLGSIDRRAFTNWNMSFKHQSKHWAHHLSREKQVVSGDTS